MQCTNNLKQLGLALHEYHTANGIFPPSAVWRSASNRTVLETSVATVEAGNTANLSENWMILILPYLEQTPLFKSFNLSLPITDPSNQSARATQLAVMLCPTDNYNRRPFSGASSPGGLASKMGDLWARGNYAANASMGYMSVTMCSVPVLNAAIPLNWRDRVNSGVMGANVSARVDDIKDGTSNTILLGEIRTGVTTFDVRGIWAMANASGSALWAHGYYSDDNGPNAGSAWADDTCTCSDVGTAVGGATQLAQMHMPCYQYNTFNCQQTARSLHTGGVHVCMADGSVRFISDFVQLGTSMTDLGVWDRLNLSHDGLPIDASAY